MPKFDTQLNECSLDELQSYQEIASLHIQYDCAIAVTELEKYVQRVWLNNHELVTNSSAPKEKDGLKQTIMERLIELY
ncbi:MAG: hypothetical protein NZ108_04980 [Bacteroidia bacterium]|nr:hypothetical protein [Bacteroidia bacterium]